MDILIFVLKDNPETPEYFACGACRRFWGKEQSAAEKCCIVDPCERCGKIPENKGWSLCLECSRLRREEEERRSDAKAFANAKKITPEEAPTHMVYWEGGSGGDCQGEGYYSSIQAVIDECRDDNVEIPEYVWACEERGLHIEARDIIDTMLDEWYEDAREDISASAEKELQELLNNWCEAQAMRCYEPNYKLAILIPEEWRNEEEEENPPPETPNPSTEG